MYAIRRFSKLFKRWTLYLDRISDLSWTPRTHETPREIPRQSETKRKQALQSEANVCRRQRKCNLKKTSLINCTGHPIRHRTPNTNEGLRSRTSNEKSIRSWGIIIKGHKNLKKKCLVELKGVRLPRICDNFSITDVCSNAKPIEIINCFHSWVNNRG